MMNRDETGDTDEQQEKRVSGKRESRLHSHLFVTITSASVSSPYEYHHCRDPAKLPIPLSPGVEGGLAMPPRPCVAWPRLHSSASIFDTRVLPE
jgi:hypothetical protein